MTGCSEQACANDGRDDGQIALDRSMGRLLAKDRYRAPSPEDEARPAFREALLAKLKARMTENAAASIDSSENNPGDLTPEDRAFRFALRELRMAPAEIEVDPQPRPEYRLGLYLRLHAAARAKQQKQTPDAVAAALDPAAARGSWASRPSMWSVVASHTLSAAAAAALVLATAFIWIPKADDSPQKTAPAQTASVPAGAVVNAGSVTSASEPSAVPLAIAAAASSALGAGPAPRQMRDAFGSIIDNDPFSKTTVTRADKAALEQLDSALVAAQSRWPNLAPNFDPALDLGLDFAAAARASGPGRSRGVTVAGGGGAHPMLPAPPASSASRAMPSPVRHVPDASVVPQPDAEALALFPEAQMPRRMVLGAVEFRPDDASPWSFVDESEVDIAPGARWRVPKNGAAQPLHGFGYPEGHIDVVMRPGSELQVTEQGFALVRGEISARLTSDAARPLPLVVDGQPVAVEPGSRVRVSAPDPADYAKDGAPAPRLRLDKNGLAFVKMESGVAPLFPCREYRIDRYRYHDLSGFPLPDAESGPRAGADERSDQSAAAELAGYRREGGRWLAPGYKGQETTPVKRLSRDYLTLLRQHRALAPILAAGGPMVVEADGRFFEIVEP